MIIICILLTDNMLWFLTFNVVEHLGDKLIPVIIYVTADSITILSLFISVTLRKQETLCFSLEEKLLTFMIH